MYDNCHVSVLIPALNEERAIASVLTTLPDWVDDVIVVDNASTDATAEVAERHGARVIHEPVQGYGQACLSGVSALRPTDIVVFLDGDFSDDPSDIKTIIHDVAKGCKDMVLGWRHPDLSAQHALSLSQKVGNRLACWLIKRLWGHTYHDLGPFRAIRRTALEQLDMVDRGYGWTVEMQIKAVRSGLRIAEVPVRYRDRIGVSKISGTLRGVVGASCKILWTIFRYGIRKRCAPGQNQLSLATSRKKFSTKRVPASASR